MLAQTKPKMGQFIFFFFAQRDHLRVFHYVKDCSNLMDK